MKKILTITALFLAAFSFNSCSDLLPAIDLPSWDYSYNFWINPQKSGEIMQMENVIEADIKGFLEKNGADLDIDKIASVKIESVDFEILQTEDTLGENFDFSWLSDIYSGLEIKGANPKGLEDLATYPGQGPEEQRMSLAINNDIELKEYFLKETGDTLFATASGKLNKDLNARVEIQANLKLKVTLN